MDMGTNESVPAMKIIARIHSEFPEKFGIPRQSGLVNALHSEVIFEPEYRNPDAIRGLADFSHIWLIWEFSESIRSHWSPTVRPPRLGGNIRMGVFATRSPFRPNPIGLSSVRLLRIEQTASLGPVLHLAGADLMDGTPILDIKPYLPYGDCHCDAVGGFADHNPKSLLQVDFPPELLNAIPDNHQEALIGVLAQDPRPPYQESSDRIYGLDFADFNIRFTVQGSILYVQEVTQRR
jgi:tRNA-Thr(GGU) m(6)t(6)A37 methyltransferase TsaA